MAAVEDQSTASRFWGMHWAPLVLGALTWLGLVFWASLAFLQDTSATHRLNDKWVLWVALLVVWFVSATIIHIVLVRKPKDGMSEEDKKSAPTDTAVIVVHGMGVQDQYQMLALFRDGLLSFSDRPNLMSIRQGDKRRDAYQLFESHGARFDLYEAYWGFLFNGLTKVNGIALFGLGFLSRVIPTLASRVWKKRTYDLSWALGTMVTVAILSLGIYSGFYISARRLEELNKNISTEQSAEQPKLKKISESASSDVPTPNQTAQELREQTKVDDVFGEKTATRKYGVIREKADRYASRKHVTVPDQNPILDLDGKVNNPPDYGQRLENTGEFVAKSWGEMFRIQQIPLDKPFKTLSFVPLLSLILGALYSAAFAMLGACLIRFLYAQINRIIAESHGITSNKHRRIANQRWLEATWSSIKLGAAALPIVLLIDPVLELLLIQLFMTAGLFALISWFIKWWLENFLGDVQIYATYNTNSKFSEARKKATDLVAERICELLDGTYENVYVVGHSLGSVVALNAIRNINRTDADKLTRLKGFVTIGSPLRKFRQLFQPQSYKWPFVEFNIEQDQQIFRSDDGQGGGSVEWRNYWYGSDIFADRLAYWPFGQLAKDLHDASPEVSRGILHHPMTNAAEKDITGFRVREKDDHYLGFRVGLWTHSDYWEDPKFVDPFLDWVMGPAASGPRSSSRTETQ
jgi:pimeloyl-ACP methyl ester carboxylesterase